MSTSTRVNPPINRLFIMFAPLLAPLAIFGAARFFFRIEHLIVMLALIAVNVTDALAVVTCYQQRWGRRPPTKKRSIAAVEFAALNRAAEILPDFASSRYGEEWRGELYDLRASGASWWHRMIFIATILRTTATLAVILRRWPSCSPPRNNRLHGSPRGRNPIAAEG